MRARVSLWIFALLCVASLGTVSATPQELRTQDATPAGQPTQLTLPAGQALFPSVAPDQTVAYSRKDGADWDIYVLRHAAPPVNLTANSALDDWQADFSPDGNFLAFRSERDGGGIYMMTAAGKNLRRLTSTGFNPKWSPDGKEIVYSSTQVIADPAYRPIRGTLSAVKVATGERRLVWDLSDAVQPAWSPHGDRIAFWGFASQGGQRDIWTVAATGGSPVPVTQDVATDWSPVWAPDGKSLYFASDRGGTMEIWRVGIDEKTGQVLGLPGQMTHRGGAGKRGHIAFAEVGTLLYYSDQTLSQRLEKVGFDPVSGKTVGEPMRVLDANLAPTNVDVSPDGQSLVFYSAIQQENLYVSRADGTNLRRITNSASKDRGPVWSPDGNRIAFYSDRSGSYEIWTINADGTNLKQLTSTPGANRSGIVWAPDGSRLLYVQRRGTSWDTYIIDPDKSPSEQVVEELPAIGNSDEYFNATSWSGDGLKIAGNRVFIDRAVPGGIFVYTIASRTFQMIADDAAGGRWLNDSRRLIYPDGMNNKIFLVDTLSRKLEEILPGARGSLGAVRLTADNRHIYMNMSTAQSHIWKLTLPPGL